jgi:hypothetical protein
MVLRVPDLERANISGTNHHLKENSMSTNAPVSSIEVEREKNFIEGVKGIINDLDIFQSLSQASQRTLSDIVSLHETSDNDKWRENLSEKVSGLVSEMQERINPETLSLPAQEKMGWFIDISSEDARVLSKGKPFDEIMEHACDRNLHLPKSYIDKLNNDLYDKKVTVDQVKALVDTVAKANEDKGYEWWEIKNPQHRQPVLRFQDRFGKTHAYISERVNKSTQEKFFAACKLTDRGQSIQIGTHRNIDVLERRVSAYMTGIIIHEVVKGMNRIAEKKPPEKEKTQGMDI